MSIISKFVYGWNHLEPILLGTLARSHNILLLGSHGSGKSVFARLVSAAVGNGDNFKFIKYEMSKENLISMVGCPSPEALKEGRIDYATHERSVFNADVIMMDEITRAGRENQNMVLEILEERTVFGKPLKYKFVIATANEETYKGAYKLDQALLDRFLAVIPIPSIDSRENIVGAEEIAKMLDLNQGKRDESIEETNKEIREAVEAIRKTYDELWANTKLRTNLNEFASKFFASLLGNLKEFNRTAGKDGNVKISFRQISSQFVPLALSVASYYKAVQDNIDYLQVGTWDAIKYSIGTKLGFPVDKVKPIFESLKDLLIDGDTLMTRVIVSLTTGSTKGRIVALKKYSKEVKDQMEYAEKVNIIGNLINEIQDTDAGTIELLELADILSKNKINEQAECSTKMRLFNRAIKANHHQDVASFF